MASRNTYITGRPGFIADHNSIVQNDGRQIDWAGIDETYRQGGFLVTSPGGAIATATSITVTAVTGPIPKGTLLNWTGADKVAVVSADVAAGATSIPVEALDAAVTAGDTAVVPGTGPKMLKAGTAVGDAASTTGKLRPRVASSNVAIGLLATNAIENDRSAAQTGYGVIIGGAVYEALLPDAAGSPRVLASGIKTELNAAGTGFAFVLYADDRP